MKKTLIEPADVTRQALFAGGWYETHWCRERPATKLSLLNGAARQMEDAVVLLAPVTSDSLVAKIRQLRSFLDQQTWSRLAKAERL